MYIYMYNHAMYVYVCIYIYIYTYVHAIICRLFLCMSHQPATSRTHNRIPWFNRHSPWRPERGARPSFFDGNGAGLLCEVRPEILAMAGHGLVRKKRKYPCLWYLFYIYCVSICPSIDLSIYRSICLLI